MSFILGLFIGIFVTWLIETILQKISFLRKKFWDNHKPILGYHIHHSILGLPFLAVGLFALYYPFTNALFFLGLGIGIIALHTITAKHFTFIEKSKK